MALEATSDLVIGQWVDSPRLRAAIEAPIDAIREEVLPAFDRLTLMRHIDTAEGVWLDYLGVRVGIRRPATTDPSMDLRFGFTGPTQSRGFDTVPFSGDAANAAVYPLPDGIFRRFVKSRAILVLSDGSLQSFSKATRVIDPSSSVRDLRNMVVNIYTDQQVFFELADAINALPRTAGVRVEYLALSAFGFDQSGVGYDQGPFRT